MLFSLKITPKIREMSKKIGEITQKIEKGIGLDRVLK